MPYSVLNIIGIYLKEFKFSQVYIINIYYSLKKHQMIYRLLMIFHFIQTF